MEIAQIAMEKERRYEVDKTQVRRLVCFARRSPSRLNPPPLPTWTMSASTSAIRVTIDSSVAICFKGSCLEVVPVHTEKETAPSYQVNDDWKEALTKDNHGV